MEQHLLTQDEAQVTPAPYRSPVPEQEVTEQETTASAPAMERIAAASSEELPALLKQEAALRRREGMDYAIVVAVAFAGMAWALQRLFTDPQDFNTNVGVCCLLMLGLFASALLHLECCATYYGRLSGGSQPGFAPEGCA
jgi:ferric-dicitrate binding protein FerR (iron transport regulator)